MWPRRQWSKLSSRTINNPSFSFQDLRSLVNDTAADGNTPQSTTTTTTTTTTANGTRTTATAARVSVFHRVRIATAALRAWKSLSTSPSTPAEEKKIVLYYTSLRVVRTTFEECRAVRSILRGFLVEIDERDLSMDSGFLTELKQIVGSKKKLSLPRVFIGGRYIGGFEEIQQLHENGDLKKIVQGVPPAVNGGGVCDCCGGMRFILCQVCNGSHKYYSDKSGFRTCNACNENGLVRCPDCCAVN